MHKKTAPVLSRKSLGILCILLSAFCFAVMNAFIRLAGDIPTVQKSFFRNLISLVIASAAILKSGEKPSIKSGSLKYFILRSLFGTCGILCNYYAVDSMNLSDASMLNKMSPFFAVVFSYLLLREKLSAVQGIIIASAFAGSLFIVKPSAEIFSNPASFIGLIGGLCAGLAYTMVRILGQRKENKSLIVLFFSAFSCIAVLPFVIAGFQPMSLYQTAMLIGAGLAAAGGQYGITSAYCYAPAREISVYDYSQLIFSMLLGFILFGQIPDSMSITGYIIIIASAVGMYFYNNRKK